MFTIRQTPEFARWLAGLRDGMTRWRLATRLRKATLGNLGDVAPVGAGVSEMREHFGPGWRMYYMQRGPVLVVMLGGGDKSTQQADIAAAVALAAAIEEWGMGAKIKLADLPVFNIVEHLDSDQAIAEYLQVVMEDNDPALLAAALGDVARARGMAHIAEAAGLTREALYKALRPGAQPRFDTIARVCTALGLKLVVQPVTHG